MLRQPSTSLAHAMGYDANRLPIEPTPNISAARVAKRAGEKRRAKIKYPDIKIGEQPMPISVMAMLIWVGVVARANSNAPPPAPASNSTEAVRRGPMRSRAAPTGICMAAKAMNHSPEA